MSLRKGIATKWLLLRQKFRQSLCSYKMYRGIEVTFLQRQELWAAFLDVEKAYDIVDVHDMHA